MRQAISTPLARDWFPCSSSLISSASYRQFFFHLALLRIRTKSTSLFGCACVCLCIFMMPTLLPACVWPYQGVGVVWRVAARRRGGKTRFHGDVTCHGRTSVGREAHTNGREPSRHLHAATTVETIHTHQLSAALILLTEINQTAEGKCSYLGLFTVPLFDAGIFSLISLLENTTQLGSIWTPDCRVRS